MTEKNYKQFLEREDSKYFLHPTTPIKENYENGPSIIFTEGKGIHLKDIDGKEYIDGVSSLWNINVGHGREELAEAAMKQMKKLEYNSCFNGFSHEPAIKLASKIASLTPKNLNVSFFTCSGSDANDTAYKLARYYWKVKGKPEKNKIISRNLAYHGLNLASTSATGLSAFHEMGPLMEGFVHVSPPDCNNCELNMEYPGCKLACAGEMEKVIKKEGPENVGAILMEPVQGAGGVIIPPEGYVEKVREICDEYQVLMIADEIITGFGRTGKMFGMEHYQVMPDIMLLAKGITSASLPLGAVVISEEMHLELVDKAPGLLPHGYTYSGHPVCCMTALANIEIIERENLVENSKIMGEVLLKRLTEIKEEISIVTDARALGLIGAIELKKDNISLEKFDKTAGIAKRVYKKALNNGLICRPISFASDIVALAPPLVIDRAQVDKSCDILKEAVEETYQELKNENIIK